MALRINTNVAAINAHRQLQQTEQRLSINMERLSSGYRINHASDDAAGLSIANRLRANVKSL
ncbi:MAG: flagellin, partial [Deltaproteobacteria bacterium]|nr:flagellin [Deltaproteobacteria bacterium]